MPLFKSKLTLEEQLIQTRMKTDNKIAESRAKFDKENAKMDEESRKMGIPALPEELISVIRTNTDLEIIKYRSDSDEELNKLALEKAQLTSGTKEYKALLKKERRQIKIDEAYSLTFLHNEEVEQRNLTIAKLNEQIVQHKAHDKAVLKEIASDFRGIKSDFIEENRRITEQNRQRVHGHNLQNEKFDDFNGHDDYEDSNVLTQAEELRTLKGLLDDGILTQDEFDAQKSKILGNG